MKYDNIHMMLVFQDDKHVYVLYLKFFNAISLIIFYYVEYYLTIHGRLVYRLHIFIMV